MPWTERDLEIYPRGCYLYQTYNEIDTSSRTVRRHGDDHFFSAGLFGSFDVWSVDLEAIIAETRRQHFCLDSFRLTGRYLWYNDIVGDPFSLMTGITLIKATTSALHDISSFHHGKLEGESFISIGKERTCWDDWLSRWWGCLGIGVGDHGNPWIRGQLAWEKNFQRNRHVRFFLNTLVGLGKHTLSVDSFDGYGPIRHRSVDIGIRFSKRTDFCGIFRLGYARRIYACNFPRGAHFLFFSYLFPFGL